MCVYENSPEFWPEGLDCDPEKIIFTGIDPDASASLIISINWDGSSATKNNIKVDDPNLYRDTFIINQELRSENVTATLGVSPTKFIDKETVDLLTLEIVVTDQVMAINNNINLKGLYAYFKGTLHPKRAMPNLQRDPV